MKVRVEPIKERRCRDFQALDTGPEPMTGEFLLEEAPGPFHQVEVRRVHGKPQGVTRPCCSAHQARTSRDR